VEGSGTKRAIETSRIITEQQLRIISSIYLRGFDVVKKSRDERVGWGVAVLINNKIKYTEKVLC
jgi:hypothetical protein